MTESQTTPTSGEITQLGKGLQVRHLTMMGLGSAIGAGLFPGTDVSIEAAGPGVLIFYAIASLIVVLVMQVLGEMAAARLTLGSLSTHAEMAFGPSAGFVLGRLYWFMFIMVPGVEITGTGAIMGAWFSISGWIPGLVCVIFFTVANLANVRGFDESELWFAFIRVAVIIASLVIGVPLFLSLLPDTSFVGMAHITESGFPPNGVFGIAAGLLAAAFTFGGTEIATIVAVEAEDPQRSIAATVRSIIFHISVFYLGCVAITILLLPYSQIGGADSAAESPFTQVLKQANIPGAVGFMEAIIVLALLSALNAQIYATSRLVYSTSTRGEASRFFAHTDEGAIPNYAVIMSTVFTFASVGLQIVFDGSSVLVFLLDVVGGCLLAIWLVIALPEVKLQPQMEANNELPVRMWAHPVLSWVVVILIMGPTVDMPTDPGARQQVITVVCVTAFLAVLVALTKKSRTAAREALEPSDSN